jgi:hypothetical protein
LADFTGRSQTTIFTAHRVPQIKASEIITLELGRQTEIEVTKQLEREVDTDRFTRLDRMLIAELREHQCYPAWGPAANRRPKCLIELASVGSMLGTMA